MILIDFKCLDCLTITEIDKITVESDTPKEVICNNCGSSNTQRIWSIGAVDVAEGKTGNYKSGYNNNIVYHTSALSPNSKGKKVVRK
jgi:hypothetical protein